MDFQQIAVAIVGGGVTVVGGALTVAGKYVFDRWMETHKASISLSSKRRERYFDKQAVVVPTVYEKIAKFVYDASAIYIEEDLDDMTDFDFEYLSEGIEKAEKSQAEFKEYIMVNRIYLPESVLSKLDSIEAKLDSALLDASMIDKDDEKPFECFDRKDFENGIDEATEELKKLQIELRELIL